MGFSYRVTVLAIAVAMSASASAFAAQHVANAQERAAVMKPINAYISAANTGNFKAFHAQYAPASTFVDEFAPYEWSGTNAQDRYFADFGKTLTTLKMTEAKLVAGTPTYSYVDGSRAYVVLPVSVTAKIAGKPYTESGSMAITLLQSGGVWKISVQCWTKGPENFNPY